MTEAYVVLVTAPRGEGWSLAKKLLEERLVACANVIGVRSAYWWKGRIEEAEEDLLVLKTWGAAVDRLVSRVKELHSYEVPEVLALRVDKCYEKYCEWLAAETRV